MLTCVKKINTSQRRFRILLSFQMLRYVNQGHAKESCFGKSSWHPDRALNLVFTVMISLFWCQVLNPADWVHFYAVR